MWLYNFVLWICLITLIAHDSPLFLLTGNLLYTRYIKCYHSLIFLRKRKILRARFPKDVISHLVFLQLSRQESLEPEERQYYCPPYFIKGIWNVLVFQRSFLMSMEDVRTALKLINSSPVSKWRVVFPHIHLNLVYFVTVIQVLCHQNLISFN